MKQVFVGNQSSKEPSFVFANPGTYRVNLVVKNGCDSILSSKNVNVFAVPYIKITSSQSACINQCYTPSAVFNSCLGAIDPTSYSWTFSGGNPSTSNQRSPGCVIFSALGTSPITVSAANECGTSTSSPFNLNIISAPAPTISGPATACSNYTGNVYTTELGMTNYVWSVTGGNITAGGTATNNTATVTWTSTGSQSISVNYTDGCSAATPTVYNVLVNPTPVPTITGPNSTCVGSTGNTYITQPGMTNYTWTVSSGGTITTGGTSTDNTITITWTTIGTKTVCVNYTNGSGCSALSATCYNVTVNAIPPPPITGPSSAGITSPGKVYVTQAGQTGYIWNITGGNITLNNGTNSITVTWTTAGPQTVSVNYTNSTGCTAANPTVYNVTVNPLPVPTITGSATACVGSTGNVYTTQAGMSNYIWNKSSGGTITAGGGTSSNTITIKWDAVGVQNVSVSYTNGNGCISPSPTSYNVSVNPLPAPSISGNFTIGVGTNSNYTTESGFSNYQWTVSAGGTINSGQGTNDINVTWNAAGVQSICVSYQNQFGCTNQTCQQITANPYPTQYNVGGGGSYCQGGDGMTVTLDGSATGITYYLMIQYQSGYIYYQSSGHPISGSGNPLTWDSIKDAGVYTILAINNATNLQTYMNGTVTINFIPLPTVYTLIPSGDTCSGTMIRLNGSQTGIRYDLKLGTGPNPPIIKSLPGTGLPGFLNFGIQTAPGLYRCWAVDTVHAPQCGRWMDSTIVIHPNPTAFNVGPAGILCEGQQICLDGSQIGVNYLLIQTNIFPNVTLETKTGT
ncbi:MAG: hypothetical protein WCL00_11235, partial [Bacteroidota bacterium]